LKDFLSTTFRLRPISFHFISFMNEIFHSAQISQLPSLAISSFSPRCIVTVKSFIVSASWERVDEAEIFWSFKSPKIYNKKIKLLCRHSHSVLRKTYGKNYKRGALTWKSYTREPLMKGKAQYSWPPCTNLLRLAPFYIENIIYICYKTSYLNEEVNGTEPSPSVSVPCFVCPLQIFTL